MTYGHSDQGVLRARGPVRGQFPDNGPDAVAGGVRLPVQNGCRCHVHGGAEGGPVIRGRRRDYPTRLRDDVPAGGLSPAACLAHPVAAARHELDKLRVSVIIMGPLAYGTDPTLTRPMEKFLSAVAGASPRSDEGVLLWQYP